MPVGQRVPVKSSLVNVHANQSDFKEGREVMSEETAPPKNRAWHYADGKWTLGDDPVRDEWAAAGWTPNEERFLLGLGYELLLSVGVRYIGGLHLWGKADGSALIATGVEEAIRYWYVASAPDAMDICARWGALVRDCVLTDVIDDIAGNDTDGKLLEGIILRISKALGL